MLACMYAGQVYRARDDGTHDLSPTALPTRRDVLHHLEALQAFRVSGRRHMLAKAV